MSDALPDAADRLLDADPDEFNSAEAFREFVDSQLAELRADGRERDDLLDDHGDRLDDVGARTEALSMRTQRALDAAEQAAERAEQAERMAAWGGVGYDSRLDRVVTTLTIRARNNPNTTHGPEGRETTHADYITPTEEDRGEGRGARPGVVELLDGAISARTARSYVRDLGECAGLSVRESTRGGWGGGSDQMALRMDLTAFRAAYGEDWSIDDLLADMGGDDG